MISLDDDDICSASRLCGRTRDKVSKFLGRAACQDFRFLSAHPIDKLDLAANGQNRDDQHGRTAPTTIRILLVRYAAVVCVFVLHSPVVNSNNHIPLPNTIQPF